MRVQSIWVLLFLVGADSQVALAQNEGDQLSSSRSAAPPPSRPRVSDDELLKGQSPTASFGELPRILQPGYKIVVWDAVGRKTRGRVSSISEIAWRSTNEPRRPFFACSSLRKTVHFPDFGGAN